MGLEELWRLRVDKELLAEPREMQLIAAAVSVAACAPIVLGATDVLDCSVLSAYQAKRRIV